MTPSTRELLNAVAQYVIYTPQTAVMRGLLQDNRGVEPLGLTGGRLPHAVREVLAQRSQEKRMRRDVTEILEIIWKPGWAEQVNVAPPNLDIAPDAQSSKEQVIYIRDKYMQRTRNTLSLLDASEGTLFLLFVATILAHAGSPPIFALDNVDGTLNPSMVRSLVGHIVSIVCGDNVTGDETGIRPHQVFLTTHNPSALDAMDLFEADQRLFVVSRNNTGHTVFERIHPSDGMTKEGWMTAMKGRNLSQLWLDGRLKNALGTQK